MALTGFQSSILKLLAENRRKNGGSYVAGGLALNHRTSRSARHLVDFAAERA